MGSYSTISRLLLLCLVFTLANIEIYGHTTQNGEYITSPDMKSVLKNSPERVFSIASEKGSLSLMRTTMYFAHLDNAMSGGSLYAMSNFDMTDASPKVKRTDYYRNWDSYFEFSDEEKMDWLVGQLDKDEALLYFSQYVPLTTDMKVHRSWAGFDKERKDTVALKEYWKVLANKHYACTILMPDGSAHFVPIFEGEYNLMETDFFNEYKVYLGDPDSKEHFDLYDIFWGKVGKFLKKRKIKRAYYDGQGVYEFLSLEALYNPRSNKYLIDELEIYRLGSLVSLGQAHRRSRPVRQKDVLLMGDPNFELRDDLLLSNAIGPKETPTDLLNRYDSLKWNFVMGGLMEIDEHSQESLNRLNSIDPLHHSASEIRLISKLLKSSGYEQLKAFLDSNANETNLKKFGNLSPGILHISSHFYEFKVQTLTDFRLQMAMALLYRQGEPFTIWTIPLSGIREEYSFTKTDGYISAYDLYRLSLGRTDLLNLSICGQFSDERLMEKSFRYSLGYGQDDYVTGINTVLWDAALLTGVKSVLCSQWPIDDESASIFMPLFYKFWLQDGMGKREALTAAKRKLREHKSFSAPYHWAGYLILGNN